MERDQSDPGSCVACCTQNLGRSENYGELDRKSPPEVLPLWSFTHYSIISFAHTVLSAIVNFFRSITLADILNGLKTIFRGIFIDLPQLLWSALKALGRGIEKTLIAFFGYLYWIVYYIIYGLIWVVMFVPKRLGEILGSIAGGIAKAFRELWIWISPKSMA